MGCGPVDNWRYAGRFGPRGISSLTWAASAPLTYLTPRIVRREFELIIHEPYFVCLPRPTIYYPTITCTIEVHKVMYGSPRSA